MKKYYLLLLCLFLSAPFFASAATLTVKIDTGAYSINTLEATIILPKNISVTHVDDGNSALLIWIKAPVYDALTNTISFAGITPGGFQGVFSLLSLSGDFSVADLRNVTFSGVNALQNDGKGTAAPVHLSAVSSQTLTDTSAPEIFTPSIGQSSDIFNGQYFIVFLAQDKGTGIEHYDVAYSEFFSPQEKDWQRAESPLLLASNTLSKKIFIRAVDQSGNARVESIVGPHYYQSLVLWSIIIVFFTCVLFYIARKYISE
jgi:hypothetical protein